MASSKRKAAKKAAPKKTPKKRTTASTKKPEQVSENCLHMHCKQWLDKSGLWDSLLIFHVANERRGGFGTHMHFKRMGVLPGTADWLAFKPMRDGGQAIAIELKDADGEQSKSQEEFEKRWKACGFRYVIVRSVEEFQDTVRSFYLFG